MTFHTRFAIKGPDDRLHVLTATPRRELGDEWLAPSARTYHIDFQGSLTPSTQPAPTPATAFTPVSLVMVRPCGQYHGEIVYNTAWRPVATITIEGESVPVLEFTEHPPWPINSSIPDRKWTP
jgi:hypothetical protein